MPIEYGIPNDFTPDPVGDSYSIENTRIFPENIYVVTMSKKSGQITWRVPLENLNRIVVSTDQDEVHYFKDDDGGELHDAIKQIGLLDNSTGFITRVDENGKI